MKLFYSLSLALFSVLVQSQSLALDPSFGTNGLCYRTNSGDIKPNNGYFENNQYYLFGNGGRFARYNYDGTTDWSFGVYGFHVFSIPGEYPILRNFKMHNGKCYGFGKSYSNSTLTDGIIVRLTVEGQLDPTFGVAGVLRLNLGSHEYFKDILINDDGSFYALGVKETTDYDGRVLLCKFLENGSLDTSFNSTGYKVFQFNQMAKGISLFPYGNGILLGNWTTVTNSNSVILLQKIDYNGNLMSDFGTNGELQIPIPVFGSANAENFYNLKFVGNRVYAHYYWGLSFSTQGYGMYVFDITNPVTPVWSIGMFGDSYFNISDSGKIMIARGVNCIVPSCSSTKYTITQYNADGTLDTTFDNDGVYEYDFSTYFSTIEGATFFYPHEDGRLFIAGKYNNLCMLRIGLPDLSMQNIDKEDSFYIYPNPSSKTLYIHNKTNASLENIYIVDVLGKKIDVQANYDSVDITDLSKGIYFLSFTANGNLHSLKFIKS